MRMVSGEWRCRITEFRCLLPTDEQNLFLSRTVRTHKEELRQLTHSTKLQSCHVLDGEKKTAVTLPTCIRYARMLVLPTDRILRSSLLFYFS